MMQLFVPDTFTIDKILAELASMGATSVRILSESFRKSLLQEAQSHTYTPEAEVVGSGDRIVRQQLGSCIPATSYCTLLQHAFQTLLDERLANLAVYPFATHLSFNTMVLQRYEKGSLGITPHRDRFSYINLVCVFILGGQGKFYICADRVGRDAREIDASPGTIVLLKAPGFLGLNDRPFHYVTDIQQTRYTLGLRQKLATQR